MVEMVEILDGRLGKRSVVRVRYVINNLLHLVIVKYGDISLVLCISTRLMSLLVKYLVILHADPCNKSYNIYDRCPTVRTFLIRMPMYVWAFEYIAIEIQVLRKGRLSSLNNRSSGISNVPSSYVNDRQCACVSARKKHGSATIIENCICPWYKVLGEVVYM